MSDEQYNQLFTLGTRTTHFTGLPRIRSERPAFGLRYPHIITRMREESHIGRNTHPAQTIDTSS